MIALTRTTTEVLAILLAIWLTIGVTLAVAMGRRGHSAFQWLFLGAVLGPLALPLAWTSIRDERQSHMRELVESVPGAGAVDVLVGIDGSPESDSALRSAVRLLGSRIGRLTLASVIGFDTMSGQAKKNEERAVELLEGSAASVEVPTPGTILLSGQPADALTRHASAEGYDLLVVGRHGRGLSKALLGSTASRVANAPNVPVLIV